MFESDNDRYLSHSATRCKDSSQPQWGTLLRVMRAAVVALSNEIYFYLRGGYKGANRMRAGGWIYERQTL